MTDKEKELADLLMKVKKDKYFGASMLMIAKEADAVEQMIRFIKENKIQNEDELYAIVFEELLDE